MAEESGRTLVCSVLFIDIVGYSKKSVAEQFELKRDFNALLAGALEVLKRRDRIVVDTGDGAAVVFLGDPEDALIVGVAMRSRAARIGVRMGINLGPVKLISDLNDQVNVVGDGINVAQRVMSFAEPSQLLVSSHYQDVVSRLSDQYSTLFTREGRRHDKHVREHEVYSVSDAIRIGGESLLDEPAKQLDTTGTFRAPAQADAAAPPEPVKLLDAGPNLIVSGASRVAVTQALEHLIRDGAKMVSPATLVGQKWIASCSRPKLSSEVKVEEFGLTRVITGEDREAVDDKAAELVAFGAKLVRPVELVDGVWTAVCDTQS